MAQYTIFSMKTIGKYLRELSVIVVGVTITVSIGLLVNKSNSRKELKQYLHAVKLELEENIKSLDKQIFFLERSWKYANYLQSHDIKSLNPDSINSYSIPDTIYFFSIPYNLLFITYKTNAYEMFKASGMMRLLGDKELMLSIWNVYSNLEELKLIHDIYSQVKKDEGMKEIHLGMEGKPVAIPMYNYFKIFAGDILYEMSKSKDNSEDIKELVAKLEKEL
jgi:hypothetical protein